MTDKNDKVTYSDELIRNFIFFTRKRDRENVGVAMLQQLLEQRDRARKERDTARDALYEVQGILEHESSQVFNERNTILKDLKALEGEVNYVFAHKSSMDGSVEYIDLKRSEKYAQSGGEE